MTNANASSTKPLTYEPTLETAISALSQQFLNGGYSDISEMDRQVYEAFWTDTAQADLIQCIFPTHRQRSSGSVRPVYPKGGFDPNAQQLSSKGFSKLLEIAWENCTTPPTSERWSQLDGYRSSLPGMQGGVPTIIGAAIKPINMAVVSIDIDLNFFGSTILPEAVAEYIVNASHAYRVRGNHERITLVLRQTQCLKDFFNTEYPEHSRITFIHGVHTDAKIEVNFREGVSNNILGAHKHHRSYQVVLPDNDAIGHMDEATFISLVQHLDDGGFTTKKSDGMSRGGRLLAWEIEKVPEFAADVDRLLKLIEGGKALKKKFGISAAVSLFDLLSASAQQILAGKIRYAEANRHLEVDPTDVYPISDGFRRNTTWQVFSDIAFTAQFLEEFKIPFDPTEEDRLVLRIAEMIQPDISDVFVSVYDDITAAYTSKKCKKWSHDYTLNVYKCEYRKGEKSTVSHTFAQGFLTQVGNALGAILQDFIYSKQKAELNKRGQTLKPPTMEQSLQLAAIAERTEESIAEFSDIDIEGIFDVIFENLEVQDTLIDEDAIDQAATQRDLKYQYRLKATNDNWGIFPIHFGNHSHRYLRRQKGASYPSCVALMAALISHAGIFQITADPIDDDVFDAVSLKDGRKRYTLNTEGNMLLVMQLLTGDSGSGKSYVTKPLETAARIAAQSVNMIDQDTTNFFRAIVDDKGKLRQVKDYTPQSGVPQGSVIHPLEYADIHQHIRSKEPQSFINFSETYTMTDHSAETAAFRDAMMETEMRMRVRELSNRKLFSGSFYHPVFLFYDEAGAFIEITYQSSARITSFCEMKAGNMKEFRRAKSNASGSQNNIQFWAATMHGNLPLPKYLSTAYKADVKDCKAEGVLGRIIMGYIERKDENDEIEFVSKYGGNSDEEVIATLSTIAMLIPSAMRRIETEFDGNSISYFSSGRNTGNFFMDADAIEHLPNIHDRLKAKVEAMKDVYPDHSYAYDTYIGKIYEMLYTIAGGHKLTGDLIEMAGRVIPLMNPRFQVGSDHITYSGWEISRYVKDRGIQNYHNHTQLLSALMEVLIQLKDDKKLKPITRQNIKLGSLQAAEIILTHHYDVLMYSETLYCKMFGADTDSFDAARKATSTAMAERHSTGYVAYRIIDNLDRQIRRASNGNMTIRQSDVLRNILYQTSKGGNDDSEKTRQLVMMTFNTLMSRLVRDDHMETSGKGTTWKLLTGYREIQPLLAELRGNFAAQI